MTADRFPTYVQGVAQVVWVLHNQYLVIVQEYPTKEH